MDQGLIADPKALERMSHELESLERRITSLEDDELEVMERLEGAQGMLDDLVAQIAAADARLATLAGSRDEKVGEIDMRVSDLEGQRDATLDGVPADLLALYEKLRTAKNGVGAAMLHQRRCNGCQLGIDNAELAVIKAAPADEVVRCEECSRILVRTAESGL